MQPLFADAIDVPFVLLVGGLVLVPLLAFEVSVEALVLARTWRQPFRKLCRYTLVANCWSLIAGIPVKFANAGIYEWLLPHDLPGYFHRYPYAAWLGSLIYFVVTVLVEAAYAFRWLRRNPCSVGPAKLWTGVLLANAVTYSVLAPLHYYITRPNQSIREFTTDARWAAHPTVKLLFTDADSHHLRLIRVDGSAQKTIVPLPVRDFLVSADLGFCLFRGTNGNLYSYRRATRQATLVWQTHEQFGMDQTAFSPTTRYVAFACRDGDYLEVLELHTGRRVRQATPYRFERSGMPSLAWSPQESRFFVRGFGTNSPVAVVIQPGLLSRPGFDLSLEALNATNPPVSRCFGRTGSAVWYGGDDWGSIYNQDECGDLNVQTEPGLASSLTIYRRGLARMPVLWFSVNPGLLHVARFYFRDAAFLDGCRECVFDVDGYIYLLDIQARRVGTVTPGERFILLTSRFAKRF